MNETTNNDSLQAFISDSKQSVADQNDAYIIRAEKGSSKRKSLLKDLIKTNNLIKSAADYIPSGTVVVVGVPVNLTFDVTTILPSAGYYSNHIRISVIVNSLSPLTLYDSTLNFEGVAVSTIFDAIKTAINAGGSGWTVSGTFPLMAVVPPVTTPVSTFAYFTVYEYFNLNATSGAPYISGAATSASGAAMQRRASGYGLGFLYVLDSANTSIKAFNAAATVSSHTITNIGVSAGTMVINASTGKIYVDTTSGQDDIIEIAHTAANTWTEAVKAGAGDLVSGPRMGVYNPFNTSVYFVNGFRLTRITSGGTLTRMASARLYIVCNSITGDILSHGQTTIVDFTKAADATPAVDSTVTLPFTIAGQMAFWNPDGTNPNARFFIPKVSTAIVYMYDTDLLVLRRTITFTGKTVTGCIIPEETGNYLFVTFNDSTTGVYNMSTNTWICTLYSTAAPTFIVHHPTTGYRTVKGNGTVFAPVLIAESSDDIQTGTPIGEVIQSADDNCLTAVQQQTLLDNITHYTTC